MTYLDQHTAVVTAPPDQVWGFVSHLGGDARVWTPGPLWRFRGAMDRVLGGPGFEIGGPDRTLEPGDEVDFWEVVSVRAPSRLRLRARTRLPGTAYLDVLVRPHSAGSELTLRTEFEPSGAAGHAYWWASVAAHAATFELMTRRMADLAGAQPTSA